MEKRGQEEKIMAGMVGTNLLAQVGFVVKDIEETLGVTKTAVCKWQRGETLPTIDNLVGLAAMLNVTLNEIVVTD